MRWKKDKDLSANCFFSLVKSEKIPLLQEGSQKSVKQLLTFKVFRYLFIRWDVKQKKLNKSPKRIFASIQQRCSVICENSGLHSGGTAWASVPVFLAFSKKIAGIRHSNIYLIWDTNTGSHLLFSPNNCRISAEESTFFKSRSLRSREKKHTRCHGKNIFQSPMGFFSDPVILCVAKMVSSSHVTATAGN